MEEQTYLKIAIGLPAEQIKQIKVMEIAAKHKPELERMFKEVFQTFGKIYDECIQAGVVPPVTKREFIETAAMTYWQDAYFKDPSRD